MLTTGDHEKMTGEDHCLSRGLQVSDIDPPDRWPQQNEAITRLMPVTPEASHSGTRISSNGLTVSTPLCHLKSGGARFSASGNGEIHFSQRTKPCLHRISDDPPFVWSWQ